MFNKKLTSTFIFNFVLLLCLQSINAQDWTQWRGANRDGVVKDFIAPTAYPEKLKLIWKTQVGSGYSSPVVFKDKAWIHSRRGEEEVVTCLDLKTGKLLWSQNYTVPFNKNQYAVTMGKGPNSTPVYYKGNLYTFGVNALLSCFDANTGKLKWRKDFGIPDTSKLFCGTAMSPVIENGNVIVHAGDDIKGGVMTAFDAATGKEKWTLKCDGPGYASPIVVMIAGVRQLVTMTDKSVIGVATQNGKLLWTFPWADEWNENIVTPVLYKDTLILSGVRKGTIAIHAIKNGEQWAAKQIWHNAEIAMYMNSPVLDGDYLFGMSAKRKGQYFAMEAATGKVLWQTEGREGMNASFLVANDVLFILNSEASLIVAKKNAKAFEKIAEYSVADSSTYAHPIVMGKKILVKDDAAMMLWSLE
jgi:outer membrane protein assembly factor BamB